MLLSTLNRSTLSSGKYFLSIVWMHFKMPCCNIHDMFPESTGLRERRLICQHKIPSASPFSICESMSENTGRLYGFLADLASVKTLLTFKFKLPESSLRRFI